MEDFVRVLRQWYLENRRDLPWRNTCDPYPIWLSEIILQQTRVNQGLPYYQRFIDAFPTINDLADAPADKVMRLWQGLGYYSRARNLHQAAKEVRDLHSGVFPADYHSIRALKGVGDYTAAAIASFAFNLPYAVVDGNVYRFLSRLTGNDTPIDTPKGKKVFAESAAEFLDKKQPGLHNQAMMELGATVCTPAPDCNSCPFSGACQAFLNDRISELPVKSKKTKVRDRHLHFFLFEQKGHTWIQQRQGKDIWTGLYQFPVIETGVDGGQAMDFILHNRLKTHSSREYRHILSHQKLFARFHHIRDSKPPGFFNDLQKVNVADLDFFAFPQLIIRYLKEEEFLPVLNGLPNN